MTVRARPDRSRGISVGSSSAVARFSTPTESEPMLRPAGSTIRIGRLRKYVNGSEFWTTAVTPSWTRSPAITRTRGGFTR
jgi:hypothetical protein